MADKHANMPGMSEQPKKPVQGKTPEKPQKPPKLEKSDGSAYRDKAKDQPKTR